MTRFSLPLFTAVGIAAMTALASAAAAIEYPWCAQYNGEEGGGRNCGFSTIEQCMATVRGIGGFCEQNLFYTGPAERPAKPTRKRRND
jgi:Protein of unknown function (DUF3551)